MEELATDLWIFDGEPVRFMSLPYSTRMTVVRLASGDLWVHSPIRLSAAIKARLKTLGPVRYLIAPNHLHHLFLAQWVEAYPETWVYGTDEVIKKRADIAFHGSLNDSGTWAWQDEIEQHIFSGSPFMQECVFFHRASATLIVADLVENFSGKDFNCCQRFAARCAGILAPNGKMPLDWRLSFIFAKGEARQHFKRIVAWKPRALIMAHGEIIRDGASDFLARSFKWLA